MKRVLVLMSTYNGEKYLAEQINSILHQTDVDVNILVRDDGSRDSTVQMLEKYSLRHKNIKYFLGENVGFVQSFSKLVCKAVDYGDFDFYAFADQDDVWYANKLVTAVNSLQMKSNDKPHLFASNCMLIDGNGNNLHLLRNHALHYRMGNSLYSGSIQGCCMTFNRCALLLYAKHPPLTTYHDTWMLYICALLGDVEYDVAPLFGYRIHSNNALGMGHNQDKGILRRIINRLRGNHNRLFYNSSLEFKDKFKGELEAGSLKILDDYLIYRSCIAAKIRILSNKQYGSLCNSFRTQLTFCKNVIFNNL